MQLYKDESEMRRAREKKFNENRLKQEEKWSYRSRGI
jgi:hypothetical protein